MPPRAATSAREALNPREPSREHRKPCPGRLRPEPLDRRSQRAQRVRAGGPTPLARADHGVPPPRRRDDVDLVGPGPVPPAPHLRGLGEVGAPVRDPVAAEVLEGRAHVVVEVCLHEGEHLVHPPALQSAPVREDVPEPEHEERIADAVEASPSGEAARLRACGARGSRVEVSRARRGARRGVSRAGMSVTGVTPVPLRGLPVTAGRAVSRD